MAEAQKEDGSNKAPTGVADIRAAVEGAGAPGESSDQDDDDDEGGGDEADDKGSGSDAGGESGADDDDHSDADDGEEEDGAEGAEGKPKPGEKQEPKNRQFTQFAGDGTDDQYISNLEKGYQNSSAEAIRLKGEFETAQSRVDAIMRAAATDPDLAQKLNTVIQGKPGEEGSGDKPAAAAVENPFLRNMRAEWEQKSTKEIETFIEANPEVATDPTIEASVKKWMKIFSDQAMNDEGRLMSGGEAMEAAYRHLGLENKLGKQKLADGAKGVAGTTRPRGKAKKTDGQKPRFTDSQIAMAKAMGKNEDWLAQNAK